MKTCQEKIFRLFPSRGQIRPEKPGGLKGGWDLAENARKRKKGAPSVKGGYEKLAFGSVNDAVRLLFGEEPGPEELGRMDFGNIAEIRRLKDGGLEIKFYDRLKALECLRGLAERGAGDSPLYRALLECAKNPGEGKEDGV